MNRSIKLKAYGKINLFLDIAGKRQDGYHNIYSVMQSIDIADYISVSTRETPGIYVTSSDPSIPTDENNIVWQAVREVGNYTGQNIGAEIHIEKNIPTQAGLGGGSADGAAVIRGLTELYGLSLSKRQLIDIALKIGSDVPFCLFGGTYEARGRGEVLNELASISGENLVLIKPDFSVSTAWAYKKYKSMSKKKHDYRDVPGGLLNRKTRGKFAYNIFEEICSADYPVIKQIKQESIELGADYALMSGSGSAFFVVSGNETILNRIYEYFAEKDYFVQICSFIDKGNEVIDQKS